MLSRNYILCVSPAVITLFDMSDSNKFNIVIVGHCTGIYIMRLLLLMYNVT